MITTNSILNEIPSLIGQFSKLVSDKTITLPFKVSYALSKNAASAREAEANLYEFRDKLQKKHCEYDGKVPKTQLVGEGAQQRSEIVFKSDDDKKKYQEELSEYMAKEIKFNAFTIKESELSGVDNIPPALLSIMDKYGIIV